MFYSLCLSYFSLCRSCFGGDRRCRKRSSQSGYGATGRVAPAPGRSGCGRLRKLNPGSPGSPKSDCRIRIGVLHRAPPDRWGLSWPAAGDKEKDFTTGLACIIEDEVSVITNRRLWKVSYENRLLDPNHFCDPSASSPPPVRFHKRPQPSGQNHDLSLRLCRLRQANG
jgi:hypothetical protein